MNKNLLETFRNKRVLITGHTGFKGSWLSLWLLSLGAEVKGLSLDIPSSPSHYEAAKLQNKVGFLATDIRDTQLIEVAVKDYQPDFLFHLAAQSLVRHSYLNPVETWGTNTFGTVNILDALRNLDGKCVAIFITSDKCYDNQEWVWGYKETDRLGGPDPYSASKGAAELAISSYIRSYFPSGGKVRIGIGRAGNVIGGGDWAKDRIVPDSVRSWADGATVLLRNPGATRPWQHVLEPLSGYLNLAMRLSIDLSIHGEPFNFGPSASQERTVEGLVVEMSNYWDLVQFQNTISNSSPVYESSLLKLNCDKAMHLLGWRSTWNFEETVKETMLWYREYYENSHRSMADYSINQIVKYTALAKKQGLPWAQ